MQTINIGNTEIAYTDCGTGAPLLFVHGFAENHRIWSKLTPALEKTNRVICIDLPGSGKSSPLQVNTTIEALADIVQLFLKQLNINKCAIMGHSMGGYVALALLEKYPEYFSAIGLIHSTSYTDDENKKQIREKAIDFMTKYGVKMFLEAAIPDLYFDQSTNSHHIEEHIEMGTTSGILSLQEYYRAMIKRCDRADILRKSNIPVLFVCGSYDKAVPISQSLQQTYLAKETHVHILQNTAHMGMIEETELVVEAIQHFIPYSNKSIS